MYRTLTQYAVGLVIALGFWVMVIVASFVTDDAPAQVATVSATSTLCLSTDGAQDDYDGQSHMAEDESPWTGFYGGELMSYSAGEYSEIAIYSDGSFTDGTCWYNLADAPEVATQAGE